MNTQSVPRLVKWPFIAGDVLLVAFAAAAIYLSNAPLELWLVVATGSAVLCGALLCVTPFIMEYRVALKMFETATLSSALAQLQRLEKIGSQVGSATAQWQTAHELSEKTVQTAHTITERISAEAKAFMEFLQKSNDSGKANLRLEVEKLHRAEGEWLKIIIGLLDHTYALFQAGVRSEQPGLIEQLSNFQSACRDLVRRVGLVPFEAAPDEPFNNELHQLLDADAKPGSETRISQILATGYTYQGQLIRRALVSVEIQPATQETPLPAAPLEAEPAAAEAAIPEAEPASPEAATPEAEAPGQDWETPEQAAPELDEQIPAPIDEPEAEPATDSDQTQRQPVYEELEPADEPPREAQSPEQPQQQPQEPGQPDLPRQRPLPL